MRNSIVFAGLLATVLFTAGCSEEKKPRTFDFVGHPSLTERPSEWRHAEKEEFLKLPQLLSVDLLIKHSMTAHHDYYSFKKQMEEDVLNGEKKAFRLYRNKLDSDLGPANIFIVGMWSLLSNGHDVGKNNNFRRQKSIQALRAQLDANGMQDVQIHFIAFEKPGTWGFVDWDKVYPAYWGDTITNGGILNEFCLDSFSFGFADIGVEWFIKWKSLYLAPNPDQYSSEDLNFHFPPWNAKAPVIVVTDQDRRVIGAWGNYEKTDKDELTVHIADHLKIPRDELIGIGRLEGVSLFWGQDNVSIDAMTKAQNNIFESLNSMAEGFFTEPRN